MAQKKTPLLQKLRKQSGTLYVFPSASEDIGINLNSNITGVSLTHYALINIPGIDPEKWLFNDSGLLNDDNNFLFGDNINFIPTLSLQNYMMNLETTLLNQPSYNVKKLETVSEKCFWHWMMKNGTFPNNEDPDNEKLGVIKFQNEYYYYEKDRINNIVKCLGSIDGGNSITTEFGIFNETYINIPSSYGGGPVFFRKRYSDSYNENSVNCNYPNAIVYGANEYLQGRTAADKHSISYSGGNDRPWYDNNDTLTYNLNTGSDNQPEALEIVKDINIIKELCKELYSNVDHNYIFSYDDINIDPENRLVSSEDGLLQVSPEFEFNAILLYYSIYDQNAINKQAYATNLFGIIFLDGVNKNGNTYYINGLKKVKSSTYDFGTSYSFRVNVKSMSIYDNSDSTIQDNTTNASIQASDYSGAVSQLNRAIDILNTNTEVISNIQNNYQKILTVYDRNESAIYNLKKDVENIKSGSLRPIYTLDSLYCNDFYSRSEQNNENSSITFYLANNEKDEKGQTAYSTDTEPYALKITHNGISASTIQSGTSFHKQSFKVNEKGILDSSIWVTPSKLNNILYSKEQRDQLQTTQELLTEMFNPDNGILQIKVFNDPKNYISNKTETTGNPIFNKLYIAENSPIFDETKTQAHLSFLKDKNTAHIDYTGFVPYLIAHAQKTNKNFNYEYQRQNNIFDINDVVTMKDALDFIFNMLYWDDMQNFLYKLTAEVYEVSINPSTGQIERGEKLNNLCENKQPYFFKNDNVIIVYKWEACEPNYNALSGVILNKGIPNNSQEINEYNILEFISNNEYPNVVNFNDVQYNINTEIKQEDDINKSNRLETTTVYSGEFYVSSPSTSINTSLTLISNSIQSEKMRNLVNKKIEANVKCMYKCYYFTSVNEIDPTLLNISNIDVYYKDKPSDSIFSLYNLINDVDQDTRNKVLDEMQYFIIEDRIATLPETLLTPIFKPNLENDIVVGNTDMYIYFMLPYYDDINFENIHIYANLDMGTTGFVKYENGSCIDIVENGKTTKYRLYRTTQKQFNYVNIKLG